MANDHDCDIFDILRMAGVYGVEEPDLRCAGNCYIDSDVDIFDARAH